MSEEDDDMTDFIVESDEDEEEKDVRRALKRRLGKRKSFIVLDSDEEMADTPEEKEVIFGAKKVPVSEKEIATMSRFLPSTKMKVYLTSCPVCPITLSPIVVYDGAITEVERAET